MQQDTSSFSPEKRWPWRLLAGILILGAAGLHLAYLGCNCPLSLAPDEAHYWDWSRHLDWSYYSKGPLVAYLIRAGCFLAGGISNQLLGNEMLAVRLPAVLCGSLLLVSLYILTVQVFANEKLAAFLVGCGLTMPLISAGSSLMTIDSPYTCCWGWALVLAYQAIFRQSAWAWPLAGLVVGIGILAKYTMVLFLPSVGLFLLTSAEHRRLLLRPGFWVMAGIAGLCCLPILIWNAQNGWVTFMHVGNLAGLQKGPRVHLLGPLHYLGGQLALLLGFWFVAWLSAMVAQRPWKESDSGIRYLWWLSAPMFAVFFLFGFKTGGGELNWPVTAYLSGMVLTAGWLTRQFQTPSAWYRRLAISCLVLALTLDLAVLGLMHFSDRLYPVLAQVAGGPTDAQPMPLRRVDPTCRLRGWQTLAGEIDRLKSEIRAQGIEPVLAASNWALPGELAFYCNDHPTVYSVGLPLGDRRSQYDFWRPNPVWDVSHFKGKTFVIVGDLGPQAADAFDRIDPPRLLTHFEKGYPIICWPIHICRGFRGFPADLLKQPKY